MKTTQSHFAYFQERVLYWIQQFGITGWQCYFEHALVEGVYAVTSAKSIYRVVTFTLTTNWYDSSGRRLNKEEINKTARHEAIHLLILPLQALVYGAFVTEDEALTETESLVHSLDKLLP